MGSPWMPRSRLGLNFPLYLERCQNHWKGKYNCTNWGFLERQVAADLPGEIIVNTQCASAVKLYNNSMASASVE